jgi:hypothetical protein
MFLLELPSMRRALLVLMIAGLARAAEPVQIHPANPKYFLFRGKPLVLVTATEHYGAVMNRPFDYRKYLDHAAQQHQTLTRTFLLYRELQTSRNPWSPCKPETPDFITPWVRTGPGKAMDGEPIWDLDQCNPEYFARLKDFLTLASARGIVVELTLFSHSYADAIWALNPLRAKNNKQGVGTVGWGEYDTLHDKELVARQKAYIHTIIGETCGFDNVYYEICNEPAGDGKQANATTADVDAWLVEMAATVRAELGKLGKKHLVFGAQAFHVGQLKQQFDTSFPGKTWDAINIHPHTYLFWDGTQYDMGGFMNKDLTLKAVRDFCRATYPQRKPVVLDEDNAASMYRDPIGWTIHRKRAWMAVLSAAHYDYIDFSITVGRETGTPDSRRGIRAWMKNLSDFVHSFDVIHAQPSDWVSDLPTPLLAAGLAVTDKDYIAYVADARELSDPKAGTPIAGRVTLTLPGGQFQVRLYSPITGGYSPALLVEGGKPVTLELPRSEQDLAIRATRVTSDQ